MSTKKLLSTLAAGVVFAFGSGAASAAIPVFCVNDTQLGGVGAPIDGTVCAGAGTNVGTNGFAVDLLQGAYVEKLRPTSATTFQATMRP